jgi:hypothetical protein
MTTGVAGTQARNQHQQIVNTLRKQILFSDTPNGTAIKLVTLPQGAYITKVMLEVVTAFDGSASITVGSGAAATGIINAADIDETLTRVTEVTRGYGRSIAEAADIDINYKLTSTGATAGRAELVIEYEGNNG